MGARVAAHEPANLKPILFPQDKPLRPEVTTLAILDSPSETHGPRAVVRRWFEAIEQESNAELSDVLSDSAVLIRPNKDPASALLVWIRRFAALDYSTSRAAVIAAPSRIALVDHEAYQALNGVRELRLAEMREAVRRAKKSDDAAAIAGENAAHVYGLKVVAGPIEDRADNTTRFLVIGRASFPSSGHDRTSLLVFIRDQPGALYRILEPLARRGISMNRIESRPAHGALWQYAFFIEVAGHAEESPLSDALGEIDEFAGDVRVLGSYPVAVP